MENFVIENAVFAFIIVSWFLITIYLNVSGSKDKTKFEYVLADKSSASTLPMLMSIARAFLGVRVFLGYPSELFYRGTEIWETIYGISLAFPIVIYFFVPVYLRLGITSVYEYLDLRFKSKLVRCIASATYVIRTLLVLGVATLTPCIAIKTVIGIPYYVSIVIMIAAAIVFVISGGFGAALMGDAIQGVLMMGCCAMVIVKGTLDAEGPMNVINISKEKGRLNFFNFDPDPTKRATTISSLLGHLFISLSMYGCQQNFVQRYLSIKKEAKVKRILLLSIPFNVIMMSLPWIVGMVIFAAYADCDPKKLGYIQQIDEIFPFYLEDKFLYIPGLLGVVLAILFNGTLSTVVSNLNSLATVLWEDFFSNVPFFKNLTDVNCVKAIKTIAAVCGLIVLGVTFAVSKLDGIIEIFLIMTSATSGPLLGVFVIALFFPSVNWKGAVAGMVAGFLIILWIVTGSFYNAPSKTIFLPTETTKCTNDTFDRYVVEHRLNQIEESSSAIRKLDGNEVVIKNENDDKATSKHNDIFLSLYSVTYLYYSVIGTVITVLVGCLTSFLSGTHAEEYLYKDNLIHPLVVKYKPYHMPVAIEII